ncbi:putative tail assembly protein [Escherichia coli FRIK920]|nr:putative tail assembly protein [Escherichia coli FRIK920]
MIAQGNPMPVPYGEMLVGSRRISQDISTRDEGGDGKVVVIGRQVKAKKSRSGGCGNRK